MRSVFVHLWRTSEAEVSAALDHAYTKDGDEHWLGQVDDDPYLYIRFYREGPLEDESWSSRFSKCPGPPTVSIVADVSGRHDGWREAQAFVVALLEEFEGVATDDAGLRLWCLEEVDADRRIDGRRFGDWRN
jgi:hypothetical protein